MDSKFIIALIIITLALVFYTIGVFGERVLRNLKMQHVVLFYLGLVCDAIGTGIMTRMALSVADVPTAMFGSVHSITGLLAILLMLFHAIWATIVVVRNNEKQKQNFHKFSLLVWMIWLIPYSIGAFEGMH